MLRVVRITSEHRQLGSELGVIEERSFQPAHRIHDPVTSAFGSFIAVPETVGEFEPVRRDGRVENELAHLRRHEARGKSVIGLDRTQSGFSRCRRRRIRGELIRVLWGSVRQRCKRRRSENKSYKTKHAPKKMADGSLLGWFLHSDFSFRNSGHAEK